MSSRSLLRSALLSLAFAAVASAQFTFVSTQSGRSTTVDNGGSISFFAHIGQAQISNVVGTYTGKGTVTIAAGPSLVGSLAYTSTAFPSLPVQLTTGKTFAFSIQFLPTSAVQAVGQYNLTYTEAIVDLITGLTTSTSATIRFNLSGSAPSLVIAYALQTDPNTVPLGPGGSIVFAPTLVSSTALATLSFTNTGSGLGVITGISVSGAAFRVSGLPLLPYSVTPLATLQVQIQYRPTGTAIDTGTVQVSFDGEPSQTFGLQGSGSTASITYQIVQTDSVTPVAPGGTVAFPQTKLGQASPLVLRIINSGNAPGLVNSITLVGTGYTLSNPPILPLTLQPNAALSITVTFTPAQPGTTLGTLLINSDSLNLTGVGLGPQLTYSYVTAGTTVTLSTANNSVVFSPVAISGTASLPFSIKNTGTSAAILSNIGVGQAGSPFTVTGLPSLPVNVAPNAEFQFTISFAPTTLGFSNGTLVLDAASVALVGSGAQPPPLPAYTLSGASGTVPPLTQPGITLTLASPYPVALSGTLAIASSGNLTADPSVQFASGGQTVAFIIPANSTGATFGNLGTRIGLQTGTVANTITITPSFATRAGAVDLTPATPTTLQFSVAPAAPTVVFVQPTAVAAAVGATSSTLSIAVTGFSTTRTLTSLTVQFTTAPGFTMPTSKFTVDVQQLAVSWFRSTASQPFGGQFTLTVPFTFQGSVAAPQTILSAIASVSVSVSNENGASGSVQAPVQ